MNDEIKMPAAPPADVQLQMATHTVMQCMLRGAIGCSPQVRPEAVMLVMCYNMAKLLTEMYVGDDIAVHKFRKAAREIFDNTLKQEPVQRLPEQQKTAATASVAGV